MKPVPYEHIRQGMRCGDLIEWRSHTLLGYLIRWFSHQYVNHTSVVSSPDTIIESDIGGVRERFLSDELEGFNGQVFWLPLLTIHEPCRPFIKLAMTGYIGRGYDYKSFFKQIYGRVVLDAAYLFCSELAHMLYAEVGLLPKRATALQPGEFVRWRPSLFKVSDSCPHGIPFALHDNKEGSV